MKQEFAAFKVYEDGEDDGHRYVDMIAPHDGDEEAATTTYHSLYGEHEWTQLFEDGGTLCDPFTSITLESLFWAAKAVEHAILES